MGIRDVDVIKLDVEGSELGVLQGLTRRLTASRFPEVLFEFCDWVEERIEGREPGAAQAFAGLPDVSTWTLRMGSVSGPRFRTVPNRSARRRTRYIYVSNASVRGGKYISCFWLLLWHSHCFRIG